MGFEGGLSVRLTAPSRLWMSQGHTAPRPLTRQGCELMAIELPPSSRPPPPLLNTPGFLQESV